MAKKNLTITPEELRAQILKGVMELKMHKAKNTNLVKNLRRQYAQTLTKKRQEELHVSR